MRMCGHSMNHRGEIINFVSGSCPYCKVEKSTVLMEELVNSKKEEDNYRYTHIGSYPDVKIPKEVREKWLKDLNVIYDRQVEAYMSIEKFIKE